MDDPTRRCENDTDNGCAPFGALVPKQEPLFLFREALAQTGSCEPSLI
jgi:hypothetical protein